MHNSYLRNSLEVEGRSKAKHTWLPRRMSPDNKPVRQRMSADRLTRACARQQVCYNRYLVTSAVAWAFQKNLGRWFTARCIITWATRQIVAGKQTAFSEQAQICSMAHLRTAQNKHDILSKGWAHEMMWSELKLYSTAWGITPYMSWKQRLPLYLKWPRTGHSYWLQCYVALSNESLYVVPLI